MRGGLPWHPSPNGALESFRMGWDVLELQKGLNFPAHGILQAGIPQLPPWETSMALRLLSVHEGAVMHRNSNLSQRLILALTSDA